MQKHRALLLTNPRARMGQRDIAQAIKPIEQAGIEVVRPSRDLEVWDFPDYIRSDGPASDLIIVGGGDGTISSCAKAIVDRGKVSDPS